MNEKERREFLRLQSVLLKVKELIDGYLEKYYPDLKKNISEEFRRV